ncbi:tyrosine-type recombinase/integrase [Rhodobacterales bacterium LSUCC0031]|nr:tyrosine-type recombinase/integrase [Rhodobacterales bacterium LSUCC0031]
MPTIRKRNGKFQVQVRIAGQFMSRTFDTRTQAFAWGQETEKDILSGGYGAQSYTPANLAEVLRRYIRDCTPRKADPKAERYVLEAMLKEPWSQMPLCKVRTAHIAHYRDERLKTVKPSTLKRQIGILRTACLTAQREWAWQVPTKFVTSVKLPAVQETVIRRITAQDEHDLLSAASVTGHHYIAEVITLAIETGMRRSEIARMSVEDVDLERKIIVLPSTKNGRWRKVPISRRLEAKCFSGQDINQASVFEASIDGIKSAFRKVLEVKAGRRIRFHDLRHEAISRFFERGLSVPEVAAISGHRDLAVLARYSHADIDRIISIIHDHESDKL